VGDGNERGVVFVRKNEQHQDAEFGLGNVADILESLTRGHKRA